MGKCSNCGKKIEYNKFKWYRGKVLCYDCYDTRLERKKAKKLQKYTEPTKEEKDEILGAAIENLGATEINETPEEVKDEQ